MQHGGILVHATKSSKKGAFDTPSETLFFKRKTPAFIFISKPPH